MIESGGGVHAAGWDGGRRGQGVRDVRIIAAINSQSPQGSEKHWQPMTAGALLYLL